MHKLWGNIVRNLRTIQGQMFGLSAGYASGFCKPVGKSANFTSSLPAFYHTFPRGSQGFMSLFRLYFYPTSTPSIITGNNFSYYLLLKGAPV